ncbi:MAG: hypothetical protein HC927_07425 [Deltaproteobacteria bacterium]|nr:hypothetical protein [Deltaproteobacteria bacterium]
MKIAILDAWSEEDPALVNSHWVAEQTRDVLLRHGFDVEVIADELDRATVRQQFDAPHDGFAYFGHGRDHVLYRDLGENGRPIALVDADDVSLIGDRWMHAFACLSGNTLCFHAADAGIAAYFGLASFAVNVEWEISGSPEQLRGSWQSS